MNGINLRLRFVTNEDIPQITMIPADVNGIDENVTISSSTPVPFSDQKLFYSAVPWEMMRQSANKPQVIVKNNGVPAVCPNNNCHFMYVAADSHITSWTPNTAADLHIAAWLQVDGLTLPYSGTYTVSFGNVPCDVSSANGENIVCYFASNPQCGDHYPHVITDSGLVANQGNPTTIPLTVDSVTPAEISRAGGTKLTFAGKGFPSAGQPLPANFAVVLEEGTCTDFEFAADGTWMRCTTNGLSATDNKVKVELFVCGGNNKDFQQNVDISDETFALTGFSVPSVSPVILSEFDLTIDGDYTHWTDCDNIVDAAGRKGLLWFVKSTDTSVRRPATCTSLDTTAKTMHVKFNGAPSGAYNLEMSYEFTDGVSTFTGRFTSAVMLEVFAKVTSLSRHSLSIHGGNILRIRGENFSNDILDNPVNMARKKLTLTSSSPTEIVLRIPAGEYKNGKNREIITFLRTSEEAGCHDSNNCVVTFDESVVPIIESGSITYDSDNGCFLYTINGQNFGDVLEDTTVFMDGQSMEILSASDSKIVVKVEGLSGSTVNGIHVIPSNGMADPYGFSFDPATFAPLLHSVSPNFYSAHGSQVTLTIPGLVAGDSVEVQDSEGTTICTSVATAYGTVKCQVAAGATLVDGIVTVIVNGAHTISSCSNTDTDACNLAKLANSPALEYSSACGLEKLEISITDPIADYDLQVIVGDYFKSSFVTEGSCDCNTRGSSTGKGASKSSSSNSGSGWGWHKKWKKHSHGSSSGKDSSRSHKHSKGFSSKSGKCNKLTGTTFCAHFKCGLPVTDSGIEFPVAARFINDDKNWHTVQEDTKTYSQNFNTNQVSTQDT